MLLPIRRARDLLVVKVEVKCVVDSLLLMQDFLIHQMLLRLLAIVVRHELLLPRESALSPNHVARFLLP